jgi:hypothetical protein
MISWSRAKLGALGLVLLPVLLFPAQKGEILRESEQDKLREEQDPSKRIGIYLDIAEDRLTTFESYRMRPADPKHDIGGYLDDLLGEYIGVYDELKNWIEYQYRRDGDMRPGLRGLLERAPQQLARLRSIKESSDPYVSSYEASLEDAIDQVSDTLDGATVALAEQQKKFPEIKEDKKEAARLAKERAKEEAKRTKEEEKLRKQQGKRRVPGDTGDN